MQVFLPDLIHTAQSITEMFKTFAIDEWAVL